MNSEELWAGLAAGDPAAWEECLAVLLRCIWKYSPGVAEAAGKDIAQEIAIDIHRRGLEDFCAEPAALLHVLRRAAVTRTISWARQVRPSDPVGGSDDDSREGDPGERRSSDDAASPDGGTGEPLEDLLEVERRRALKRAAGRLDALVGEVGNATCQEVLPLFFRCKRGDPELPNVPAIAERIGIKANTCWQRIHGCVKKLLRLPEAVRLREEFAALLAG